MITPYPYPEYVQPKHVDITDTIRADAPANDKHPDFAIRLVEVGCKGPVFYNPEQGFFCMGFAARAEQLGRVLDEACKINAVKSAFEKLRPLGADEAFTSSGLRVRTTFEFYQEGRSLAYKLPLAGKNDDATKVVGSVAVAHATGLVAGSRRLYTLMCEHACVHAWRLLYPPNPLKIEFGGPPIDMVAEAEKPLGRGVHAHRATRHELADAKRRIANLEGYNAQAAQTNRQLVESAANERLASERMRGSLRGEINRLDAEIDRLRTKAARFATALCDVKNGKEPRDIGFLSSADGNACGVIEFDR